LLAELPDRERDQTEEDFFRDDQFFERLRAVEDELVDDYVTGALSDDARHRFQTHFLTTPERHRKVALAMAIQRAQIVDPDVGRAPSGRADHWWSKALTLWPAWRLALVASSVGAVALALLVQGWPWAPSPARLASLQDTTGAVTTDSDRTVMLAGLGPLPGPLARSVEQFVTTGGIAMTPRAAAASATVRGDQTRRAFPTLGDGPVPASPAHTGIRSERPTLHWMTAAGARSYTVVLVDQDRKPLWRASTAAETALTVPSGLIESGRVYFWQVEASVDGQIITGPAAGFWLIDDESLQIVRRLEGPYQGSAVVRAAVYAEHGLYEEALAQVEQLEQLNPQHPRVRAMRDFLNVQLGRQ
jgi:hypothetical protein